MPITEETLRAVEEAAKAATPGPWTKHVHSGSLKGEAHINGAHGCAIAYVGFGTQTDDHYVRGDEAEANAAHIETANPANVVALIAAYREQGRETASLKEFIRLSPKYDEIYAIIREKDSALAACDAEIATLRATLEKARAWAEDLESGIGQCGCTPGRCEQYPETELFFYGRLCREAIRARGTL